MSAGELEERVREFQHAFSDACSRSGRRESDVVVIAASKTRSWEEIRRLSALGFSHFGENYVQEALGKIEQGKRGSPGPLSWHLIGTLQSNKARFIPGNFSLFHALDSSGLAKRLARACGGAGIRLDCAIEVNLDGESSKGGMDPDSLPAFLEELNALQELCVRGLMCIPAPVPARDPRRPFSLLRELRDGMNRAGAYREPLSMLSMGMSGDFPAAILEGATHIRVGNALFGPRDSRA